MSEKEEYEVNKLEMKIVYIPLGDKFLDGLAERLRKEGRKVIRVS